MNSLNDSSPLKLPFASIDVSHSFAKAAIENGYNNLSQLLNVPLHDLLNAGWFTHEMLDELGRLIRQYSVKRTGG